MSSLTLPAVMENLEKSIEFIVQEFARAGFDEKALLRVHLACEEAIVNIIHYAYPDGEGDMTCAVNCDPDSCSITLSDAGIAYDPLAKDDPDINVPIEQRQIGGLGIFMVKEIMDKVYYERKEGRNILTLIKYRK